jgi:hypothetical protein
LRRLSGSRVTAIAEEADGNGIVFGTFAGKLARFDLQTGDLYKLADLPVGGGVEALIFAADGKALAVASGLRKTSGMTPPPIRAWEVWDYCKLRDSAKFLSRAEKKQPAPSDQASPDEASPEDLLKWRSVRAKGNRK